MPSESTRGPMDAADADADGSAPTDPSGADGDPEPADRAPRLSRRAVLAGVASLGTLSGCLATRTAEPAEIDAAASVNRTETATEYRLETEWTYDDVAYSVAYRVPREAYRRARSRQPAFYSGIFDGARTAEASRTLTRNVVETAYASPVPERLRDFESAIVDVPGPESTGQIREVVAFEAVRSFLQSLPYGEDADTTGRIEYCRHVEETLVEGVGDCEDYTAVAAGMFAQPPFEYDTVCVFLPDHITLAIARRDLPSAIGERVPPSGTISVAGAEYVFFDPVSDDPAGLDVETPTRVEAVYVGDGTWRKLRPTIMAETLVRTGAEVATDVAGIL